MACVGSSLYLRAKFGNGYYLTMVKQDEGAMSDARVIEEEVEEEEDEETLLKEAVRAVASAMPDENETGEGVDGPPYKKRAAAVMVKTEKTPEKEVKAVADDDDKPRAEQEEEGKYPPPPPSSSSGTESVENDILIDDEGISDVAKRNGIIINPSSADNFHEANHPTTKFVQKYVPGARLLEQIGQELIYVLPTATAAASAASAASGSTTKRFELFFSELERYMDKMSIKSYGLSDTTLEEIFLKVASNAIEGAGAGEIIRNFDCAGAEEFANVTNRVRSASESSGLRHFFSTKKKQLQKVGVGGGGHEKEEEDEEAAAAEREVADIIRDEDDCNDNHDDDADDADDGDGATPAKATADGEDHRGGRRQISITLRTDDVGIRESDAKKIFTTTKLLPHTYLSYYRSDGELQGADGGRKICYL